MKYALLPPTKLEPGTRFEPRLSVRDTQDEMWAVATSKDKLGCIWSVEQREDGEWYTVELIGISAQGKEFRAR